jgi:hypothetical protein
MADIKTLLLGFEPRDVAGTRITGELPISNVLVNRLIAEALKGRDLPVAAVVFEAQDSDRMVVHLDLRGPLPTVKLALRIDQQPQPDNPVLGMRWSLPGLGGLAALATPALSFFKALPPGIRVDGDRILVNIKDVVTQRGFGEYLNYLRALQVHAIGGRLLATFEIGV